jgi:DNA-binding transcriptional regulator of glucitol operon
MISIKGYGIHRSLQRSTPSIHRSLQRSTLDQRGKIYTGHCRGQLWIKGVKYTQVTAEVNSEDTQVTSEVNSGSKMISIPDQRGKVQYRPNTT